MQYGLGLDVDAQSLQILRQAGARIIIAKQVGDAIPNVAWLSINPLTSNQVAWEEQCGIYASSTPIQNGAIIMPMSTTPFPAQDGAVYPYERFAFGPPRGGQAPSGSYGVRSDTQGTFGLVQSATANGGRGVPGPTNASSVLPQQTAIFKPFNTVYVWAQSFVEAGSITNEALARGTKVTLNAQNSYAQLRYDPATGRFIVSNTASTRA